LGQRGVERSLWWLHADTGLGVGVVVVSMRLDFERGEEVVPIPSTWPVELVLMVVGRQVQ
jgi:hypothetical protein